MTLLDRVKKLCNDNSITLAKLEKTLGFGNGTLSRWDDSSPSGDKLLKVANYFNVSVDNLLGSDLLPDDELPKDIRAVARDLMDLTEENRKLAIDMIKIMQQRGKEAKKK